MIYIINYILLKVKLGDQALNARIVKFEELKEASFDMNEDTLFYSFNNRMDACSFYPSSSTLVSQGDEPNFAYFHSDDCEEFEQEDSKSVSNNSDENLKNHNSNNNNNVHNTSSSDFNNLPSNCVLIPSSSSFLSPRDSSGSSSSRGLSPSRVSSSSSELTKGKTESLSSYPLILSSLSFYNLFECSLLLKFYCKKLWFNVLNAEEKKEKDKEREGKVNRAENIEGYEIEKNRGNVVIKKNEVLSDFIEYSDYNDYDSNYDSDEYIYFNDEYYYCDPAFPWNDMRIGIVFVEKSSKIRNLDWYFYEKNENKEEILNKCTNQDQKNEVGKEKKRKLKDYLNYKLGSDNNSVGISMDGDIYYNGKRRRGMKRWNFFTTIKIYILKDEKYKYLNGMMVVFCFNSRTYLFIRGITEPFHIGVCFLFICLFISVFILFHI